MKILIIHNKYQSNNIGGEDIVYGHELELLQKELGNDRVFSYEVSNDDISKFKMLFSIWFSFKHYRAVKKIIIKNSIDLVHIHNFYPVLTPSIFKASRDAGAKVVHTLHNYRLWCIGSVFYRDGYGVCELCTKNKFPLQGILGKCFKKSFTQSLLVQLSFWFYRFVKAFDNIDFFFVLTEFQKAKVLSLGIDEAKVILKPNGVSIFTNTVKIQKDYIYVGRLEESKGIYELLETWRQLDDRFILTIIGGGVLEETLKSKYSQKNIIFKGQCAREEVLLNISKSKYLIQPSLLYETFGLTIVEAMGCGVPVIGFNIGTRGDLIEDGVNGFLSTKNGLKEIIEKSYDYRDYERLSYNATLKAKEYESEYIFEKQIKIYKNILER